MTSTKKFDNPYKHLPMEEKQVMTCSISKFEYQFISSIRPQQGTLVIVTGLLWTKLIEKLKQHGITDFSKATEFEQFVANCHLIGQDEYDNLTNPHPGPNDARGGLRNPTSLGPSDSQRPSTNAPNDRPATTGVGQPNPPQPPVIPDLQSKRRKSRKGQTSEGQENGPERV
jgi:hypothetical protein